MQLITGDDRKEDGDEPETAKGNIFDKKFAHLHSSSESLLKSLTEVAGEQVVNVQEHHHNSELGPEPVVVPTPVAATQVAVVGRETMNCAQSLANTSQTGPD